ncbi:MAG: hypothetical protein A3K30_00465 [Deltaproteobacteria bacterium RBG_13_51_10]|nr:MAG: hypothetical protein A3K30_00465 [Deltaproteobacteria bacterium RBG_13_51_10]
MTEEKQKELIPKPSKEQINEVVNPGLSRDTFKLGDKDIPIQILPIDDEERIVALFLPAIKEIFSFLPEKPAAKPSSDIPLSGTATEVPEKDTMASIIEKLDPVLIAKYSGVLKETIAIMAQRTDDSITKEFVGKNIHTAAMINAIIKQLEKNQIADMVTSFFFKMAQMLPRMEGARAESPPSPSN